MSTAFVILLHAGHGADHYDLMIRVDQALATWQLGADPLTLPPGGRLACRRLCDHRLAYLDYQGPVSGGRGSVRRTHAGPCEIAHSQTDSWQFRLAGQTASGTFELHRLDARADEWMLVRLD